MILRNTLLAALAALALSGPAHAAPVATPPGIPGPHALDLGPRIDALAAKAAQMPADRRLAVVHDLKKLGPPALDAMLARVAKDTPAMAAVRTQNPAAAKAFDAALLEAVGAFRTPKALPALKAAFEGPRTDARYVRAAADGLGRLCDGGGFDVLAAHARTGDRRENEAVSSLGLCRTTKTADLLAKHLAATTDPDTLIALADGIGQAGSTWAWEAMGPSVAATGAAVRRTLSDALVNAWGRTAGEARKSLRKALLMVDDARAKQLPR